MKLEIMAKNVVVGDVLVKGAHKYEITNVKTKTLGNTDLVDITYRTLKTKAIRTMTMGASQFVTVEQVEELTEKELALSDKESAEVAKEVNELFNSSDEVAADPVKEVETEIVEFFTGKGSKAKRVIMQDGYGFFIKHRGMFEAVEKNSEGVWCHVGTTPAEAYTKRNHHRYGKVKEASADPVESKNQKIINELPYEAKMQILDVYCVDQEKTIDELTLEEIISETKWCIERMKMDISENQDVDAAELTIKLCEKFLTKYEVAADPVEDNVIVHKVNAWNSEFFSDFQFVLEVAGNEFGYYMRKDEYGDKEFKIIVFGHDSFNGRQHVLAYENTLEGVERAINNFLSKGFMFFGWEMKKQKVRVKVVDAMEAFIEKITAEKQEPKMVATYELGGILVDVFEDKTDEVPFSVTVPVPPKYSTSEHKYKSATKTFKRESLYKVHELMDKIGYNLVKEENGKYYIEVDSFDFDTGDVVKEKVFFNSEKPVTPSHDFEMHPGYGNIPKGEDYTKKDIEKFERYHDLRDKSLSRKGLTDEERAETEILFKDLKLHDKRNFNKLSQLSRATH